MALQPQQSSSAAFAVPLVAQLAAQAGTSSEHLAPDPEPAEPDTPAAPAFERDEAAFMEHLRRINDIFYDQIRIADQKATFIFTFMVAFLVTSAEGRNVFNIARYATLDPITAVLSGVLAGAVVFTLFNGIFVVLPRHRSTGTSLYWGGWSNNRAAFLSAREHGNPQWVFDEYLGNVDNLSAINRAKYRHVGWSFRGLLVTVVSYCLLLAWGTATGS